MARTPLGTYPPLADVPSLRSVREQVPVSDQPELRRDVPLLNAVQFAIRTHTQRGASFNTSTNRFLNAGIEKAYVVGGEPDVHGERIPTVPVPHVDVPVAAEHIDRVRQQTGNRPNAIAGSWEVPGERIDLDVSRAFANRRQSLKVATARDEEAVWDNEAADDILTKHGRAKRAGKK